MARPLRIFNTYDLREMSDAEIDAKIVPLVLNEYANLLAAGSVRGACAILDNNGSGNSGSWVNRIRVDDVHAHPVSATNITSVSYSLDQDRSSTYTDNNFIGSVEWQTPNIVEQNIPLAHTDIFRRCRAVWSANPNVNSVNGVGSYFIGTSPPSGSGTWSVIDSWTDTYRLSGTDGSVVYNLYLKTGPAPSSGSRPMKLRNVNGDLQEMTDLEIREMAEAFGNYMLTANASNSGEYRIMSGASAPTGGTWQQVGGLSDRIAEVGNVGYNRNFVGSYTGRYGRTFLRFFSGRVVFYSGTFTGSYNRNFVGTYTGLTVLNSQVSQTYSLWKRIG